MFPRMPVKPGLQPLEYLLQAEGGVIDCSRRGAG